MLCQHDLDHIKSVANIYKVCDKIRNERLDLKWSYTDLPYNRLAIHITAEVINFKHFKNFKKIHRHKMGMYFWNS